MWLIYSQFISKCMQIHLNLFPIVSRTRLLSNLKFYSTFTMRRLSPVKTFDKWGSKLKLHLIAPIRTNLTVWSKYAFAETAWCQRWLGKRFSISFAALCWSHPFNLKRKNLHTFIDPTIWSSRIRFKGYVASDICQNHSFSRAPIVFNPILPS